MIGRRAIRIFRRRDVGELLEPLERQLAEDLEAYQWWIARVRRGPLDDREHADLEGFLRRVAADQERIAKLATLLRGIQTANATLGRLLASTSGRIFPPRGAGTRSSGQE